MGYKHIKDQLGFHIPGTSTVGRSKVETRVCTKITKDDVQSSKIIPQKMLPPMTCDSKLVGINQSIIMRFPSTAHPAEDHKLRRHATWWDLDNVTSFFRSLGHHVGSLDTKSTPNSLGLEQNPNLGWCQCRSYSPVPPTYYDIYMSNRKNPGNTKYVFDGHWLMEIDGNC